MMYSAYKLNKQGDNIQPWCIPFPNWNQSVVPCPVLTVASWPTYRFLKRQVRWSGIPISFRIFHSFLWSTQSNAAPAVVQIVRISNELLLFMVYRFHSELKEASPHIQDILSSVVKILLEKLVLTWGARFKHHSDLEIHFTGYALQQVCAVWLVLKHFHCACCLLLLSH